MPQTIKLPFNTKPQQNTDPIGVKNGTLTLINGYMEQSSSDEPIKKKRKGLSLHTNVVDGAQVTKPDLYWWDEKEILIIVSAGLVYRQDYDGDTLTDINGTGITLQTNKKCTFATNGDYLVIANGGQIVRYEYDAAATNKTAYITDTDAPTQCTHVAYLDDWLLANNVGTATIDFADFAGDPTSWNSTDAFTAQANPDDVVAMYVNNRTIIVMGRKSIEFWANNGVDPFMRIQGASKSTGVMGPHCTVFANNVGYFFDEKRRLNKLQGSSVEIVNSEYDTILQDMEIVTDCEAYYSTVHGKHLIGFNFIQADKSYIYDIFYDYWSEFQTYDSSTDTYKMFAGLRYAYATSWNLHLYSSKSLDKIYKMTSMSRKDDTALIKWEMETGTSDHGTVFNLKNAHSLTFEATTGQLDSSGNIAQMILHVKDDDFPTYGQSYIVDLGTANDTSNLVEVLELGSYRKRQYKLQHFADTDFVLGQVLERLTVHDI